MLLPNRLRASVIGSVVLTHAREIINTWRRDYNEVRPHSSLGMTPGEFAANHRAAKRSPATGDLNS
jgi:hypothetical protein